MRSPKPLLIASLGALLAAASCTLITDVDRSKIPDGQAGGAPASGGDGPAAGGTGTSPGGDGSGGADVLPMGGALGLAGGGGSPDVPAGGGGGEGGVAPIAEAGAGGMPPDAGSGAPAAGGNN